MHKLLRIVYGVLKNQQPFDTEIDRKNQEKKRTEEMVTKASEEKMFRFQEFDNEAQSVIDMQLKNAKQISPKVLIALNAGSRPALQTEKYIKQKR